MLCLGSLNFGLVCSLAATAQLWAALATAAKTTGGAVPAGGLSWVGLVREPVEAPGMLALEANDLLKAALARQCPRSSPKAFGNSVSWSLQIFLAPAVFIFQERGQAKTSNGLVSVFFKFKVFKIMLMASNIAPPWGNMRQELKICCHNANYLRISSN